MSITDDILYRNEKGSALTFAELDDNFYKLALAIDTIQLSNNAIVVVRDSLGNFSANTITANLVGNSATTTKLLNARTISLSGDVSGSASFDGSANITITTTIQANSLVLGTDTTGNYVASITNGSYITGGDGGSESAALTIAVDAATAATASKVVARDASGNFAANTITASLTGNASTATTLQTARTIGDVSFNGSANINPERIGFKDTRSTDFAPYNYAGVTLHLKANGTDSLNDGGSYHGALNLQHWSDSSGGRNHQLGFTDNGNIYHRSSTNTTVWSTWSKMYDTGDAASTATASTLVLRDASGNFSANVITASSFSGSFSGTVTGTASNAITHDGNAETSYLRYRGNITETTVNDTTTDASRTSGWYRVSYPGASDSLLDISGFGGSTPRVQFRFNYNDSIWFRAARDTDTTWDGGTSRGVLLLHSSNYNSYAPTLTGTGASGTWGISITGNANTVTNGVYTTGNQSIGGVKSFTSRAIVSVNSRTTTYTDSNFEVYTSDNTPPGISFHRAGYSATNLYENDGELYANAWTTRAQTGKLLSSGNYNSYAPSLTGTGASGTWGINITGSAASVASIAATQVAPYVDYTTPTDASGYTWIRFGFANGNSFNSGQQQIEFYVTRSINFNGNSPYGGCTAKFTAQAREWHSGQEFMTVQYGEHGAGASFTQGYYITDARIADQQGSGNWVYLRVRAGITYRFYEALHGGSGCDFSTLQGTTDPTLSQPIYHGFNLLASAGTLNYYYNGNAILHAGNYSSYAGAISGTLAQFSATTSSQLAGVISDETGSGSLVFGTSPTFTTSINSGATFSAFGSSTALTIGYNSTASSTTNISNAAAASGSIKAINIGTGGASGSATNITLGSATAGAVGNTVINTPSVIVPGNLAVGANILATTGPIATYGAFTPSGSGYMNGTHTNVAWSGGTGAYALATVTVAGGVVTAVSATWSGHRYSAGDVLTVPTLATTLATTAASGNGTTATLTFAAQAAAPFEVGANIIVAGITPVEYNGTFTVTACTTTTVSYASTATGAQTVAGTVKMGTALTNATISVASVSGSDVYVSSYTTNDIGARIRLEANDTSLSASQEYGAIVFGSRDATVNASGDVALIRAVALGTSAGSNIQFWTAPAAGSAALAATIASTGDFTAVGNVTAYSDERLKSNIRTVDNALAKVDSMRGVYFDKDGKASVGVIAQEMEKVLPEVVLDGDYKSVAYGNIVGVLIEAIKELKAEIDELKRDK